MTRPSVYRAELGEASAQFQTLLVLTSFARNRSDDFNVPQEWLNFQSVMGNGVLCWHTRNWAAYSSHGLNRLEELMAVLADGSINKVALAEASVLAASLTTGLRDDLIKACQSENLRAWV